MAEMNISGKKTGKLSINVDLTPMVDLGFLLITFFIFTTVMAKPTRLKIFLPKTVPDSLKQKTPLSGALTFLIGKHARISYYEGDDPNRMHSASLNGIREIILDKKKRTNPAGFMVIIKPGKDASFQSVVNVMDEMTIDGVKHYAMVDIDPTEYTLMTQ